MTSNFHDVVEWFGISIAPQWRLWKSVLSGCRTVLMGNALPAQFPPEERARVAEAIEQVSLALQAIAYAHQAADEGVRVAGEQKVRLNGNRCTENLSHVISV
jgi:hypothetical protein